MIARSLSIPYRPPSLSRPHPCSAHPHTVGDNVGVTIQVRAAEPHELVEVGEITAHAYAGDGLLHEDSGYVHQLRDAARRAQEAELWVAVDEADRVVGSVTYCPAGSSYREMAQDGEGEFRMLAVHPSARRRGVAEALVRRCLARSRELGDRRMVICSQREMANAHRLYARLGFERAPERDWSPFPGIDLIAFTVDL